MTTKPRVSLRTPIGKDVDLEHEDVRLKDGRRLTRDAADRITRSATGRPSLTAPGKHSPSISLRVSEETAEKLDALAEEQGKTRSDIIREAIEEKVA